MCEKLFNVHSTLQTDFSRDINISLWQAVPRFIALISGVWHKWEISSQQPEKQAEEGHGEPGSEVQLNSHQGYKLGFQMTAFLCQVCECQVHPSFSLVDCFEYTSAPFILTDCQSFINLDRKSKG